jgi:ABC-type Fe3+ transport system permease subunit
LSDIALLWTLWPSVALGETAGLSWRDLLRRGKIVALALASLATVLLVTTIATFPGEWLEDNL